MKLNGCGNGYKELDMHEIELVIGSRLKLSLNFKVGMKSCEVMRENTYLGCWVKSQAPGSNNV
jgi:hypothetical protein